MMIVSLGVKVRPIGKSFQPHFRPLRGSPFWPHGHILTTFKVNSETETKGFVTCLWITMEFKLIRQQ